jgi:hypothetical protein
MVQNNFFLWAPVEKWKEGGLHLSNRKVGGAKDTNGPLSGRKKSLGGKVAIHLHSAYFNYKAILFLFKS